MSESLIKGNILGTLPKTLKSIFEGVISMHFGFLLMLHSQS